jgi:hypothetical protein
VEEVVLTGQGGRSDAAPASDTAATADSPAAAAADPAAAATAAAVDPAAAATAAADPPATADASPATAAAPAAGVGAMPDAPAAGTAQVPAPAMAPRWANLPYAIVLALAAGGLSWVALGGLRHVQAGMIVVASALLAAAVLRLVLPERAAGLLVTRNRLFDVLALASLGAGIMAAVPVLPAS